MDEHDPPIGFFWFALIGLAVTVYVHRRNGGNIVRAYLIFAAACLLIPFVPGPLPAWYFDVVRVVATIAGGIILAAAARAKSWPWFAAAFTLVLVFAPLNPLPLTQRWWLVADAVGAGFVLAAMVYFTDHRIAHPTQAKPVR